MSPLPPSCGRESNERKDSAFRTLARLVHMENSDALAVKREAEKD
jgi:hypothetical protein